MADVTDASPPRGLESTTSRPHVFATLDGLRGVAAIAVVAYHFGERAQLPSLFPRGYLAVDFFFVLSGFVVAYAYTQRLQGDLGAFRFLLQRLIRLLPVLIPGALIGAALEFGRPNIGDAAGHFRDIGLATVLGCLAIPWPFPTAMEQTIFPINGPVWSLFFEILANVAFVAVAESLFVRAWSAALAIAGAVGIGLFLHAFGNVDVGALLINWPGGLPRVLYSFFVGVLLSGPDPRGLRARLPAVPVWGFPAILLAAFMLPPVPAPADAVIDFALVLLVFPAMVLMATASRPGPGLARVCGVAGALSYPLYAVHYPLVRGICFILLHHSVSEAGRLALAGLTVSGLTLLGWIVFRWYDQPLRRALSRWLLSGDPVAS